MSTRFAIKYTGREVLQLLGWNKGKCVVAVELLHDALLEAARELGFAEEHRALAVHFTALRLAVWAAKDLWCLLHLHALHNFLNRKWTFLMLNSIQPRRSALRALRG